MVDRVRSRPAAGEGGGSSLSITSLCEPEASGFRSE